MTSLGSVLFAAFIAGWAMPGAEVDERSLHRLQNPMSVQYLKDHLRKSQPRLVLNADVERELKRKLETDRVVQNVYRAIKLNAARIQKEPLLERRLEGRRMLAVSREMLYRINMLGMTHRLENDPGLLPRINDEVLAVCNFSDWNPSHFLDVAEMSMAVALALDWTAGRLPPATIALARTALIEKGIKPSFSEPKMGWITGNNNWNQVCHAGMIAAALAIAEVDPELAARTIGRALDGIPHAMEEYRPDGVYPEGSTYWGYGTSFTLLTIAMLESAFGRDFGLSGYPAFVESATFRVLTQAPSGWYFNFADCGDRRDDSGDIILAWFAKQTGNATFYERDRFLRALNSTERLSRVDGAGLVWLSQYEEKSSEKLPTAWKGGGANPVVIFAGGENDPHQFYFGGKGGRGMVNHGNMDAGSFVFEVNGVRWSVDPGNQSYHALERTGFDLWGRCQECDRWKLLTKNNFGHSTLTVDGRLHKVDGLAFIADFKGEPNPEATIDLTATFAGQLKSATRRFAKDSPVSMVVEDDLELLETTRTITWQMMTTADVEIVKGGAVLRQDGKSLKLENLSHPGLAVSVVSLFPAPLRLDRQIEGLKRIEIHVPAWTVEGSRTKIRIRLSGA